jgi:serine/threonine protein kinase
MGKREDYALEPRPLGTGGYAEVFQARRKSDGTLVAFKRNISRLDYESSRRLLREIAALKKLQHENIIQVLDWDDQGQWYTMPLAAGNLETMRGRLSDLGVRRALEQAAAGLSFANEQGWVHRDVTPRNILALDDSGDASRWVVADWGLVRRPSGQTSAPLTSEAVGTDGFLAPEVWIQGGHIADQRADVYGLGRVAAWAITGELPAPNLDLLPDGPWRLFVRRTTAHRAEDRPQTMKEVLALFGTLDEPSPPEDDIAKLLQRAKQGDWNALDAVAAKAIHCSGSFDAFTEIVTKLGPEELGLLLSKAPDKLLALVRGISDALRGDWNGIDFDYANTLLHWMQLAAEAAVAQGKLGMLSDICELWFPAEVGWDRWRQVERTRGFLRHLRGEAARTVAQVLRATARAPEYFRGEEAWLEADASIRSALQSVGKP